MGKDMETLISSIMNKSKEYPEYHYHDGEHLKWWQGERLMNRLLILVLLAVAALIAYVECLA